MKIGQRQHFFASVCSQTPRKLSNPCTNS